jgi:hypothetical protein
MTGHYSSLLYERRFTLCSECSLKRYLGRGLTNEQNAADGVLSPISQETAAAIHGVSALCS